MKAKDIKVGEDYAIQRHGTPGGRWASAPERAKVLAVEEHERYVYRGGMNPGKSTALMAHIEWVESSVRTDKWVVLAKVVRPWAEQEAINVEVLTTEKAAGAREAAANAAAKGLATALRDRLDGEPPSVALGRFSGVDVHLTADQATELGRILNRA